LYILYPGSYVLGAILFFIALIVLRIENYLASRKSMLESAAVETPLEQEQEQSGKTLLKRLEHEE
jgi:hypothetical protein